MVWKKEGALKAPFAIFKGGLSMLNFKEMFLYPDPNKKEVYIKIIYPAAITHLLVESLIRSMANDDESTEMQFMKNSEGQRMAEEFAFIVVEINAAAETWLGEKKICKMRELLLDHIHEENSISGKTKVELFFNEKVQPILSTLIENTSIQYN